MTPPTSRFDLMSTLVSSAVPLLIIAVYAALYASAGNSAGTATTSKPPAPAKILAAECSATTSEDCDCGPSCNEIVMQPVDLPTLCDNSGYNVTVVGTTCNNPPNVQVRVYCKNTQTGDISLALGQLVDVDNNSYGPISTGTICSGEHVIVHRVSVDSIKQLDELTVNVTCNNCSTPTPTATDTPSSTPTPTATATSSSTPTATASSTPSSTASPTPVMVTAQSGVDPDYSRDSRLACPPPEVMVSHPAGGTPPSQVSSMQWAGQSGHGWTIEATLPYRGQTSNSQVEHKCLINPLIASLGGPLFQCVPPAGHPNLSSISGTPHNFLQPIQQCQLTTPLFNHYNLDITYATRYFHAGEFWNLILSEVPYKLDVPASLPFIGPLRSENNNPSPPTARDCTVLPICPDSNAVIPSHFSAPGSPRNNTVIWWRYIGQQ